MERSRRDKRRQSKNAVKMEGVEAEEGKIQVKQIVGSFMHFVVGMGDKEWMERRLLTLPDQKIGC